jgi:CBS domain-containing membrane protein
MDWRDFLFSFRPESGSLPWAERWRSSLTATLAIALTVGLSTWLLAAPPFVVAAVGASSVLIFALPASPLAQPWSVFGSYLISAAIGVLAARFVPAMPLAAGLAVGGAILAMLSLRCLHPPAGAVALFAVIGGEPVRGLGFQYVLSPVAANALLLVALGLAINNLVPGRRYPRPHPEINPHQVRDPEPLSRFGLQHEELRAVIEEYGRPLYISGEELDEIMQIAERRRHRGPDNPVCADIMSCDVVSIRSNATLLEAWRLMRRHRLTVVPVVDTLHRVEGVVALESFIHGAKASTPGKLRGRLYELLRFPLGRDAGVASIMTKASLRVSPDTHIVDLVPAMTRGLHQVPVVDAENRLLGIVTQSDLVAALYHGCLAKA